MTSFSSDKLIQTPFIYFPGSLPQGQFPNAQTLMQLEGIDHVALGVRDIERSAKWYIEVLGFERLHEDMWEGVPTFIGKGNTGIALFPARSDAKPTSSSHRELRMLHLAFRANRQNFLAAQRELEKRGIKFEFSDHEISHSIYFRDPDGHQLEITTYDLEGAAEKIRV